MKKIQLKSGVNLVVLPTTQFKTLHIAVDFAAPLQTDSVSSRSLLSYLTAVSSKIYRNQQAVAQKTIDLYGAQYETDVMRFGQTHHVRYSMQLPAPVYLENTSYLLHDAFSFLREMIFNPLADGAQFDQETFEKERQSLVNELSSLMDDKRRYAVTKLRQLTYTTPEMRVLSSGVVADVAKLTASDVYDAYQDMINHDTMNIIVFGDIDEMQVLSELEHWPLKQREPRQLKPFYRQPIHTSVDELSEKQPDINQAILTLGYHLNLSPDDPRRFVALVFNTLFGGSPLSKLFTNVREKESLAYSIYSRWQNDTGFITVAAGLDKAKIAQTESMIAEQIADIQNGNFSEETLAAIKTSLINDYLSQQDSPASEIELVFSRLLTQRETPVAQWVAEVSAVTPVQVAELAQQLTLQSRFILLPKG